MRAIILGAAHIDRIGFASAAATATSAPGRVRRSFGGVAYNVAVGLAALGERPELVSAVGSDPDGQDLLRDLGSRSVGTALMSVVPDRATAAYHAIINADGTLLGAVADMEIYETLTDAHVTPLAAPIAEAGIVFVDANLPPETLCRIADMDRSGLLVANTVSIAKASRLGAVMTRLDVLFTNRDEARVLATDGETSPGDAAGCAAALCERGVGAAIVSHGAAPVALAQRGGEGPGDVERTTVPVPPARPVDETGAGDALIAGTLFGLLKGRDLANALTVGVAAARTCIESAGSGLPPDRIGDITKTMKG